MRTVLRSSSLLLLLAAAASNAELRIVGVDDDLERNVRSFVALAAEPCDAPRWLVQRRFRNVAKETRKALEPFGYYDPVIETSLDLEGDCWLAILRVNPGDPVQLRNVDIRVLAPASYEFLFADLTTPANLQPGTPLRHANYERLKEALQVRAAERGFAEAGFTKSTIDVWPDELAADIAIQFDTGPRYHFGDITFEQSFLDERLVSGFIDFEAGMPYDNRLLTEAYNDLSLSGYFSRIELIPDYDRATNQRIPVRVRLEPAARIEYGIGAGISTDTGPRARAGFRNSRLNARGHRLKVDLGVSTVLQALAAEYRKPLKDPRSEWLSYTAGITFEDTGTATSDSARVGVRRSKRLNRDWMRSLALDFEYDEYEVGGISSDSRLVLPAVFYDHKRADRDIFPTRGRRLTLEFRGTAQFLGSDTEFLQTTVTARFVRSLGAGTRLLARLSAGYTAKSDIDELPPSVRFFAGGDDSVRGFGYEDLGPTDEAGNIIGGSRLLVASAEYERHLRGNFYWAAFVDAGNAFEKFNVDPAVGAGVGLKWVSPIGPLRFYLAHPLNKSDRTVRLHIRLGPDL